MLMPIGVPRFAFLVFVAVPIAVACGAEGVTVPTPAQLLPDGTVDFDANTPVVDGSLPDADSGSECEPVLPDVDAGVFVAPSGADTALCGTRETPCRSVQFGIGRATTMTRPKVFVGRGTFVEHVVMKAAITLDGGWEVNGLSWTRACAAPPGATILRAPPMAAAAVEATDLGGPAATLANLAVKGRAEAEGKPGDSLYGITATGATTTLLLENVVVIVPNGGTGKGGTKGMAGVVGAAAGCSTAGAATVGQPGAIGAGSAAGTFGPTGWISAAGTDGTTGMPGGNGALGAAGSCAACVTCGAFLAGCPATVDVPKCGGTGIAGCGGAPGTQGTGAGGGGSSVGIFVWDATVQFTAGKVVVGNGGDGGVGGGGGAGGFASAGKAGATGDACTTACAADAVMCVETTTAGAGGPAGTIGGNGGSGGGGGGGSGG